MKSERKKDSASAHVKRPFGGTTAASILLIAAAIPLAYALYTGHVWEDYYITYRFSRNLADGFGLVYNHGQRVHGFTSPLGVLLPALSYLIGRSDNAALWIFRLFFCIPAYVGAAYFLAKTTNKILSPSAAIFPVLFLLFEAKSVMFAVNGMETAFMLLFLSYIIHEAVSGFKGGFWKLGVSWAGLMWTRPDSCVYIACFALASMIFIPVPRSSQVKIFLKAGLLCAALYLPWFIFAWLYYGSPVPHTVVAKNAYLWLRRGLAEGIAAKLCNLKQAMTFVFYPVYPQFGVWPFAVRAFATICGWICFLAWLAPLQRRFRDIIRFLSFFFFPLCSF